MPEMTDVFPALLSYQDALSRGWLLPPPSRAQIDPDLHLFTDHDSGKLRITYTRVDATGTVTALLMLVQVQPYEGAVCLALGYAVPEHLRGQGRATEILRAVVKENEQGFREAGHEAFAFEAVVSVDNAASIAVARKVLTHSERPITDEISGKPAIQFIGKWPV